ncbi:putative S-adenosylmethionine-dependent methyltransferase [Pelotomaculum sp. FP]|uniref:methyltransferase domain-containing protein n=1 Tax=Pelotomaculum sp. FP TaxID=261474 RepID=UPI001064BC39|nr:methyltransferase domain-containing protein [Pelotomaculum sp. FP]TEB16174.1 putative S-adenosylmethionine-dependent methyltransferase [Pelotomaculum sp. FP]
MKDYQADYNSYWKEPGRYGQTSYDNVENLAGVIIKMCGAGTLLDAGCGMGVLVRELSVRGIQAYGMDISDYVIGYSRRINENYFKSGSILNIPWPDCSFDTVVCTDVLEHLQKEDIAKSLLELYRVTRRFVFCTVSTQNDRDNRWHLTVEKRDWWESQFFQAGFRKHTLLLRQVGYEQLENETGSILLVFEKLPGAAVERYSLQDLAKERDLHMDMLRETGRRADAHIARYTAALRYIRPHDIVLDVACGMGYGSAVLWDGSNAQKVIGLDVSASAFEYASANYLPGRQGLSFEEGDAQKLERFTDNSVDLIISMETIEHLEEPDLFLKRALEILRPGGRMILSVPNEWIDEHGCDPNPYHMHVFNLDKILELVKKYFFLEQVYGQTAGGGLKLADQPRRLFAYSDSSDGCEAEWYIVVAMKDPVTREKPYVETVLWQREHYPKNHPHHYEKVYEYPWIQHALVSLGWRAQSRELIELIGQRILAQAPFDSADRGAALCILGYRILETTTPQAEHLEEIIEKIYEYTSLKPVTPMQVRWSISCLYLLAQLYLKSSRRTEAADTLKRCLELDYLYFSPTLATKAVSAALQLGTLSLADGHILEARVWWKKAIYEATRAFEVPWENWLGDVEEPLTFGLKEASQVLDMASQATYALWLTAENKNLRTNGMQDILEFSEMSRLKWLSSTTIELKKSNKESKDTVKWLESQVASWQQTSEEKEKMVIELQRWIGELTKGEQWLKSQVKSWMETVDQKDKEIIELKEWNHSLAETKQWLEHQVKSWQATAAEKEQIIKELKSWSEELVTGNRWLEEQVMNWQKTVETKERKIAELQAKIKE